MMRIFTTLVLVLMGFYSLAEASSLCSPERALYLRQLESQAYDTLALWQNTLQTKYGAISGRLENRTQIDLTLDIVNCTQEKIRKGLIYHCISDPKNSGWTLPLISRRVYLSEEHFWPARPLYKIAVLVHEATHKCGTNDAKYFRPPEVPRNVGLFGWSTIADTYSYWILSGFCIPGWDCPQKAP